MQITSTILTEIQALHAEGLNDHRIGTILGLDHSHVRYHRIKMGLPRIGANKCKIYTVYDRKTTEYIMEGTARQCAARLNIRPQTFRSYLCKFRKGVYSPYEIYEVQEHG